MLRLVLLWEQLVSRELLAVAVRVPSRSVERPQERVSAVVLAAAAVAKAGAVAGTVR